MSPRSGEHLARHRVERKNGDDASPDGRRFLLVAPWEDESAEAGTVTLVQGWRRVPKSKRGTRDG